MECFSLINHSFREKFALLKDSPTELYINFLLKICETYGYITLSQILVIYLHEEYGISDIQAGAIYGFWGVCITFWGFMTSCLNDYLGVRRSLFFGFLLSMVANICLALNTNLIVFYIVLFGILPIGNSIGIPMLTVGIKRYTTRKNRGFAYGLFYAMMNIAALISGPVVDLFNVIVCPSQSSCSSNYQYEGQESIAGNVTSSVIMGREERRIPTRLITGYRLVIWSIVVIYFTAAVITYLYLREIRVDDNDEEEENDKTDGEQEHIAEAQSPVIYDEESMPIDANSTHLLLTSFHSNDPNNTYEDQSKVISQKRVYPKSPVVEGVAYSSLRVFSNEHDYDEEQSIELTELPPHSPVISDKDSVFPNDQQTHTHPASAQYLRVKSEDYVESSTEYISPLHQNQSSPSSSSSSITLSAPPKIVSIYTFLYEILSSATFWRFCVLTLFLINLRNVFRHLDATLPTYLLRCFGPNYPKGMIYSINPIMMVWLTPTVAAFTSHWPHFTMIQYGGYVSALSPFFLAFSSSTWAVIMFMIVFSFGEAIWSPRLYDYTMSIAPEGREASFSALATLPLFAAKIPVGVMSGYLLHKYMPEGHSQEENQSQGKTMWLIIGLVTLSSPILITMFATCIREPESLKKQKSDSNSSQDKSNDINNKVQLDNQ